MRRPSLRTPRSLNSRADTGGGRGAALALLGVLAALPAGAHGQPSDHVRLGLNEHWLEHPQALDLARELGATLIRYPGGWNEIERAGWSRYDRLYEAAGERGIGLIWKETNAPCSAHAPPCEAGVATPPALDHLDEFRTHLREVARRYPELAAVEIGNEPNLPVFYGGNPRPAHYVRWLAAGYEAVKAVRPDLPVLFGGVAGTTDSSGGKIPFRAFIRRAHALGAARFYDAMGFHPYPEAQDDRGYLAEIERKIALVEREMARAGARGRPIWITEIGLWTRAGGSRGLSEEEQAERTLAIYDELRRTPSVEAVIVHRLFDDPAAGGREAGWGLTSADGRVAKPAYCRLGRASLGTLPELCLAGGPAAAPGDPGPDPQQDRWWPALAVAALILACVAALGVIRRR